MIMEKKDLQINDDKANNNINNISSVEKKQNKIDVDKNNEKNKEIKNIFNNNSSNKSTNSYLLKKINEDLEKELKSKDKLLDDYKTKYDKLEKDFKNLLLKDKLSDDYKIYHEQLEKNFKTFKSNYYNFIENLFIFIDSINNKVIGVECTVYNRLKANKDNLINNCCNLKNFFRCFDKFIMEKFN